MSLSFRHVLDLRAFAYCLSFLPSLSPSLPLSLSLFCTNICLFHDKYHFLFHINNHHWSLELMHYMKIQKNEYVKGKKANCI